MPKYRIHQKDCAPIAVEGRKFSFYIANIQYWFFVHGSPTALSVSHLESGMHAASVSPENQAARGGDVVSAKRELEDLLNRVGPERMRSILDKAPKLAATKKDTR